MPVNVTTLTFNFEIWPRQYYHESDCKKKMLIIRNSVHYNTFNLRTSFFIKVFEITQNKCLLSIAKHFVIRKVLSILSKTTKVFAKNDVTHKFIVFEKILYNFHKNRKTFVAIMMHCQAIWYLHDLFNVLTLFKILSINRT